ncbi:aminomethyltransferase, mitochondrial-like [Asterias rubens]|uniref:aminomethyltransferase, mitochondrial-like n=1 Tax=Asterias rubens TaxID=7604 RepID=UPI0014555809|nr:aminomethyltransferase, mitochondrial-like [Asterias rubens]
MVGLRKAGVLLNGLYRKKIGLTSGATSTLRRCQSEDAALKRTPLYDFHVAQGGNMVPFAGWSMPVMYKEGLAAEHTHCRTQAVIFDVSHMLQSKIYGKDRIKFVESLTVADLEGLKENTGTLSLLLNDKGGIIDDLVMSKTDQDYIYMVTNAGCTEKDLPHIQGKLADFKAAGHDVTFEPIYDMGLLALQGPLMSKVLQAGLSDDLSKLTFMTTTTADIFGIPCRITRCGYTGEDGVEISVPADRTVELTERLLGSPDASVKMAGLGARDSLRLEAGMCLYGNDIDESTTPIEATLAWTIAKRRRELRDFPAADFILQQLKDKPTRKRVGLLSKGAPPRAGAMILDEAGNEIGHVTSGCPSPTLKVNVAMGYVKTPSSKVKTKVKVQVRKRELDAEVAKMPFVPSNYFTGK